ncbi:MAG: SDR family oxidoreductase [Candidatus Hydrogenedentes bacterium]|nr:SDR family oxidoreductase [Candidatus Hydrogenedentota bacterium]
MSLALGREGVNVAVHYGASRSDAESLVKELRETGVTASCLQANLAELDQAKALYAKAESLVGPISIVVNNASVFPESSLATFEPEDLYANVDVHALAPLLIVRELKASGRRGSVLNFLDAMIADYDRKHAAYHLSKRMMYSLTRMMAMEFAPQLRVNGIAPGLILPPEGKDESYLTSLAHSNPLNTHGNVEDIVEAALFLLKSDFVTGQVIYVDGGRNLRGNMYG